MAALDFPSGPSIGDTHTDGSTVWTWDGVKWIAQSGLALSTGYTGSKGDEGESITWRGAWATGQGYGLTGELSAVENNGNTYISTNGHTSGSGTEPGVGASWTTYWDLMASKGDQGIQGIQGIQGVQGIQGIQGPIGYTGSKGEAGARTYSVTNSGTGAYTIDGSNNPTLELLRGFTYVFNVNASGHPFHIQSASGGYNSSNSLGTNEGVTNNGTDSGEIVYNVPYNAPNTLYYYCEFHAAMNGQINISDVGPAGADGNFGGATFNYTFSTTTANADPGTGTLRLNVGTNSSVTAMYIDDTDVDGTDIQSFLRTIDDSTSTIKGHFRISNRLNADDFSLFTISSISENTGYFVVNCAYVSGSASTFSNSEDLIITFARTGDKGDTGNQGPIGYTGSKGTFGWTTKTTTYTAVHLDAIIADTNGGAFTINLPASPSAGDSVLIADGDDFSSNNLTVGRNGSTIEGDAADFVLDIEHVKVEFVYDGSTWQVFPNASAASLGAAAPELYAENPSSPTAPSATGTNAVAIGGTSVASGGTSFAAGFSADATATDSLALGRDANANGIESTAIGKNAKSVGTRSFAAGNSYAASTDSFAAAIANNTSSYGATGNNAIALGKQAKAAGGSVAITIGGAGGASATVGNAFVLGANASASGTGSVVMGYNANSSAIYGTAIGFSSQASGRGSFAINGASTREYAKFGGAWGQYNIGQGQWGIIPLIQTTTTATPTALVSSGTTTAAGSDNQLILPNNSAYFFSGTIIARQDAASGTDVGAWEIKGAIRREANAGTTTLVSSTIDEFSAPTGWAVALTADTTNGGLKIEVTGVASTNIRWVATVHTSEVTYA